MSSLTLLDVGHGACAILRDDEGTVVIDGGTHQILLQYLKANNISSIDTVLISHADSDHIGGILEIILDHSISIHNIYLNTETLRTTQLWNELRIALATRESQGTIRIHAHLTTTCQQELTRQHITLEILHPSGTLALSGAGGEDTEGELLNANSMSAVIRILTTQKPEALLPGDMDGNTLDRLLSSAVDMHAEVLVFPHHGGNPGSANNSEFTARLCSAVTPSLIIFSNGRGRFSTPRQEIIEAIKAVLPLSHIACTQLSDFCIAQLPEANPPHLLCRQARGWSNRACCAGTIEIQLGTEELSVQPTIHEHRLFIEQSVPRALCAVY